MYCTVCGQQHDDNARVCPACGAPSYRPMPGVSTLSGSTYQPDAPVRFAGFWLRALALLLDTVLSAIISVIGVIPLAVALGLFSASRGTEEDLELWAGVLGNGLGVVVSWLYFALFESSSWQATPGKKALGLRVTGLNGGPIGFGRATGRYFAKVLSALTLFIGYIMAGFTEKKQALHDIIASTLVVRD